MTRAGLTLWSRLPPRWRGSSRRLDPRPTERIGALARTRGPVSGAPYPAARAKPGERQSGLPEALAAAILWSISFLHQPIPIVGEAIDASMARLPVMAVEALRT